VRHVPIAEFKDHLSEFVAAAAAGEEIAITRHGKVAARLVPADEPLEERRRRAREALERMAEARERMRAQGYSASPEDWISWKEEGRS
jgi:prevent-host-death family protein